MLLCACGEPRYDLLVDLNTDLRPRLDFEHVRTSIIGGPAGAGEEDDLVPAIDDDFLTFPGRRVAELRDLPAGVYGIHLRLVDSDGVDIATRDLRADLRTSRVFRVRITSDCLGVECPAAGDPADRTECLGGRCVPPGCTADDPSLCGTPGCADDAECSAEVSCAEGRCVMGECLATPMDSLCGDTQYCDIIDGCTERPFFPVDAGPPPSCTDGACDDGDPCTNDVCVAGSCVSTPMCSDTQYCRAGACEPTPTFALETVEADGCVDLGRDHLSGSDFTFRRSVTGRLNAAAQQYNVQVSCGTSVERAELHRLDGGGSERFSFYSSALSECWDGIYGQWRSYVEVDGERSNAVQVIYYNSSCPGIRTCSEARDFCSPCRDCDLATGYCYLGTTCTRDPTLAITTSEGPGCVDLGREHADPPALAFVITGRPASTSTQWNEHASCRLPEVSADVRRLDTSGRVTEDLPLGAAPCDNNGHGRWNVSVEIDGERSNTVEVVYFNSACLGFETCARARTYCRPDA